MLISCKGKTLNLGQMEIHRCDIICPKRVVVFCIPSHDMTEIPTTNSTNKTENQQVKVSCHCYLDFATMLSCTGHYVYENQIRSSLFPPDERKKRTEKIPLTDSMLRRVIMKVCFQIGRYLQLILEIT